MNTSYRLSLDLTVRGPLLCKSSDQLKFGVDSHSLYRDDDEGRRCAAIAGTHIKGQLRHALQELLNIASPLPDLDQPTLRQWFGPQQHDDDAAAEWEPRRALLQFSPYWLHQRERNTHVSGHTLHRIRIDETTGAVARGALLVIESALGVGEESLFRGDIHFRASAAEAKNIQRWIAKAADWLTAVGSLKGVGFGKIAAAATTLQAEPDPAAAAGDAAVSDDGALWLEFGLDRPYCFAKATDRRGNRFDSEEFIPGAALRAALLQHAAQLKHGDDDALRALARRLLDHNEDLAFTHAQPLDDAGSRPASLPQSLVRVGESFYDLAHAPEPALIDGKAPAFQIDWKGRDFDNAKALIPRKGIDRRLSVRTAINAGRGAAEDGALFALHTCDPGAHRFGAWIAWCGKPGDPDRADVLDAARRLLPAALINLGKTKARAAAPQCKAMPRGGYAEPEGTTWVVTLQSATALLPECPGLPYVNGEALLRHCYADSWQRLSDSALSLQAYFARQQVAGGRYLWERFWRKRGAAYRPELLTSPGSVFVLKATAGNDARATTLLRQWARCGLPTEQLLPETHRGWDRNPYQRQNGYGEVIVNHSLHSDPALHPARREPIDAPEENAA